MSVRSIALLVAFVACSNTEVTPTVAPRNVVTTTPAPTPLRDAAARFGFVALGDGWTWTKLDAEATRFDWSGRPASGDREVLLSFWMATIGAPELRFLPGLVQSAAANLTEDNHPCEPFDQPKDIVDVLHVERVITVCF
jgi:hypothetical protein